MLNIKTIGSFPNLIHVPTHFFKIILTRKYDDSLSQSDNERILVCCAAFLIPNTSTESTEKDMPSSLSTGEYIYKLYVQFKQFILNSFSHEPTVIDERGTIGVCFGNEEKYYSNKSEDLSRRYVSSFGRFVVKIEDLVCSECT